MISLCSIYHLCGSGETESSTAAPTTSFILIKGTLGHLAAKLKISKSFSATSFSPTKSLKPVHLIYEMSSPFFSSLTFMSPTPSPYHTAYPTDVPHPHAPFYKRLGSESASLEFRSQFWFLLVFFFLSSKRWL